MCDTLTLQDPKRRSGQEELRWQAKTLIDNSFRVFNFMFNEKKNSVEKNFAKHTFLYM